jgi:hypothetical protein
VFEGRLGLSSKNQSQNKQQQQKETIAKITKSQIQKSVQVQSHTATTTAKK